MLGFVTDHPGATRQELFAAVAGADEAKQQAAATSLNWLVERGHVVEYYNGILCAPMEHPRFRYLPEERPGSGVRGPAHRQEGTPRKAPPPAAPAEAAPSPEPAAAAPQPEAAPQVQKEATAALASETTPQPEAATQPESAAADTPEVPAAGEPAPEAVAQPQR